MKIDSAFLRARWRVLLGGAAAVLVLAIFLGRGHPPGEPAATATPAASRPALTVTATRPRAEAWPETLAAAGNIAAWQEATIGAEISNFRIVEVRAEVGDTVRKGQVLARIDPSTPASEVAEARLNAARARLQAAELRLSRTQIVAPDDGVISARTATVGSLSQPGQELFRLIRGGRLEWRAEVTASELARLRPGQAVRLTAPGGELVAGQVRTLAPTVDGQTRNALVYADVEATAGRTLGPGMFVRGEFELGRREALTLPQAAVVLREGFTYVFRLEGDDPATAKVALTKVGAGRRHGERVEIEGLAGDVRVVASGAGFLADGDTVRVVEAAP